MLSEQDRAKLNDVVGRMEQAGEPVENIQAAVNQFKTKYDAPEQTGIIDKLVNPVETLKSIPPAIRQNVVDSSGRMAQTVQEVLNPIEPLKKAAGTAITRAEYVIPLVSTLSPATAPFAVPINAATMGIGETTRGLIEGKGFSDSLKQGAMAAAISGTIGAVLGKLTPWIGKGLIKAGATDKMSPLGKTIVETNLKETTQPFNFTGVPKQESLGAAGALISGKADQTVGKVEALRKEIETVRSMLGKKVGNAKKAIKIEAVDKELYTEIEKEANNILTEYNLSLQTLGKKSTPKAVVGLQEKRLFMKKIGQYVTSIKNAKTYDELLLTKRNLNNALNSIYEKTAGKSGVTLSDESAVAERLNGIVGGAINKSKGLSQAQKEFHLFNQFLSNNNKALQKALSTTDTFERYLTQAALKGNQGDLVNLLNLDEFLTAKGAEPIAKTAVQFGARGTLEGSTHIYPSAPGLISAGLHLIPKAGAYTYSKLGGLPATVQAAIPAAVPAIGTAAYQGLTNEQ